MKQITAEHLRSLRDDVAITEVLEALGVPTGPPGRPGAPRRGASRAAPRRCSNSISRLPSRPYSAASRASLASNRRRISEGVMRW